MQDDPDSLFHQARRDQELDAACGSPTPEISDRHLRLAFLHQRMRDAERSPRRPALGIARFGGRTIGIDKES